MTSSVLRMHHVDWACEECHKQRSGELSVGWMLHGWAYAHTRRHMPPTMEDIIHLGAIVEPRRAAGGLRRVNVQVGGDLKMAWHMVEGHLEDLLEAWLRMPSDEWFRMYEEIHPFPDGNGRTGNILWNWHRGSLTVPIVPPNFWEHMDVDIEVAATRAMRDKLRREGGQL